MLEATRGAILARGPAGVTLLVEQLKSPDKALFNIGLRVARELACPEATAAVVAELEKAAPARQVVRCCRPWRTGATPRPPRPPPLQASEDVECSPGRPGRNWAAWAMPRTSRSCSPRSGKTLAEMPIIREAPRRLPPPA